MIVQLDEKINTNDPKVIRSNLIKFYSTLSKWYHFTPPIPIGEKYPCLKWKPFQSEKASALTIQAWAEDYPDCNFGICTGQKAGLVVVEADSPEAERFLSERAVPTSLQVITHRGMHHYYRYPANYNYIKTCAKIFGTDIDIRGDGGLVVAFGSVHKTGARYKPVGNWMTTPPSSLPEFNPAWFPDGINLLTKDISVCAERHEHDLSDAELTGAQQRLREWLSRRPGSTEGRDASGYVFGVACESFRRFPLTPETALPIWCEWGEGNNNTDQQGNYHPWTEAELLHKLRDAYRRVNYDPPIDEVLAAATARLESINPSEVNPEASPFASASASASEADPQPAKASASISLIWTADNVDRLADDELEVWLVDKWIEDHSLTIFSSKPYAGKTVIVRKLIADLVQGTPFFGMATLQTPVLYINTDRNRLRRTRQGIKQHIKHVDDYRTLFFMADETRLPETLKEPYIKECVKQVQEILIQRGLWRGRLLVVVDTFRSAYLRGLEKGSEQDSTMMQTVLAPVKAYVRASGISFMILHHDPKYSSGAAGSNAMPGITDQLWGFERAKGSKTGTLNIITRDDEYDPLSVKKCDDGSLVIPDDMEEKLEAAKKKQETDEKEIVATCDVVPFGADNAVTSEWVAEQLNISVRTAELRLKDAERPGIIPRVNHKGKGVRNDPKLWFRAG